VQERRAVMDKESVSTIMHFHAPIMHYYDHPTNVYVGREEYVDAEEVKEVEIPEPLKTDEAKDVLGNFIYNRLLTEELQPIDLSGTEQALLAKYICDKLEIKDVWQVFGTLWNMKSETLRTYFNRALEQKKSLDFQEKLKDIML
jgi:hypothetical protein